MGFTVFLLCLLALLVGFLLWRRVPRQHAFWIVLASDWIYALSFFLTLRAVDVVAPSLTDGFVPYFPPIILVAIFVAWALHRVKVIEEMHRKV